MINQDFAEFPEHRVGFFKLLRAINLTCFPGGLSLSESYCMLSFLSSTRIAAAAVQAGHGFGRLGIQAHHARYRGDGPEQYVLILDIA